MMLAKNADETYTALVTVENRRTGTRHVAYDEFARPICGAQPHATQYDASPMLGEFPEDFGQLDIDCPNCARMDVAEYVTEVGKE